MAEPFKIAPELIENDDVQITTEGGTFVLEHRQSGATFEYDSNAALWMPSSGVKSAIFQADDTVMSVAGDDGAMTDKDAKVIGELADEGGIGLLGINMAEEGDAIGVYGETESEDGYGLYTPDDAHVGGTVEADTVESGEVSTEVARFKGEPWHDAKAYGAVGDGESDDTQALADTFEAAGEGGNIYIPAGTYLTDLGVIEGEDKQTVIIDNDATIRAKEQTVQNPESQGGVGIISWKGTESDPYQDVTVIGGRLDGNKDNITVEGDNWFVENLEIDWTTNALVRGVGGGNAVGEHIDFDDVFDSRVEDCYIEDCGGYGVHLSNGTERNTVSDCTAINCGHDETRAGFDANQNSKHNTIEGCRAIDCFDGIDIRGEGNSVRDSRVFGSDRRGIMIRTGTGLSVSDTRVEGGANNIRIRDDVDSVTLSGCHAFGGSDFSAVSVDDGAIDVTFSDTVAHADGITFRSDYGVLDNMTVVGGDLTIEDANDVRVKSPTLLDGAALVDNGTDTQVSGLVEQS